MSRLAAMVIAVVLAALASSSFIPQDTLSSWAGFLGAKGNLRFDYASGSSPITHVQFQLPEDIAQSIRVSSVPNGWTHQKEGETLSLSGGSLRPGQSIEAQFTFLEYVAPGTLPMTVAATTAEGNTMTSAGAVVVVQQVMILRVLNILEGLTIPLFVFSALLLGYAVFRFVRPKANTVVPKTGQVVAQPHVVHWIDWWKWKKKSLPAEREEGRSVCEVCGGSGKIRKTRRSSAPCNHCKQTGRDICHHCGGTGRYGVGLTVPQTQEEVDSFMKCDYCKGSGFKSPAVPCCMCKGKRKIEFEESYEAPCPSCGGTGHK